MTKKIYLYCPAYYKSGGPELMHQLFFVLKKQKKEVFMVYWGIDKKTKLPVCHPDFLKYMCGDKWIEFKDVEDKSENILIVPEVKISILKEVNYLKKIVWWLSVDNYLAHNSFNDIRKVRGPKYAFRELFEGNAYNKLELVKKADLNLCQSEYSADFLKKLGVSKLKIDFLSDYINTNYLLKSKNVDLTGFNRYNIVFYNPAKGFKFTKKIINYSIKKNFNFKWIAIKNMTNEQIIENFQKGKVYIDFGNHPGKDRMPREAAVMGCCIITDKRGSANYFGDVGIKEKYKFNDSTEKIEEIVETIKMCLDNYSDVVKDFSDYREKILQEKESFQSNIVRIFDKK